MWQFALKEEVTVSHQFDKLYLTRVFHEHFQGGAASTSDAWICHLTNLEVELRWERF